jgi:sporulation protein YlmC with PRC-barrel domain
MADERVAGRRGRLIKQTLYLKRSLTMSEKPVTDIGRIASVQGTAETSTGGTGPQSESHAQGASGSTEGGVDQGDNSFGNPASSASDIARGAYDQGQRYGREEGERHPQSRHFFEDAAQVVRQRAAENPVVTLCAVGAIGYALAWMIHGAHSASRERSPYRGRARRDLPGQRSGKPLIESDRVEGTAVYDLRGNRIGTVQRVMIEKLSGRVAYAVMSFGGFMGFGQEEHAIPWRKLDYDTSLQGYRTDITPDQLRSAPSFSRDQDHDWSNRQQEQDLHDHYQVTAYWIVP